jgi:hypothetical protein
LATCPLKISHWSCTTAEATELRKVNYYIITVQTYLLLFITTTFHFAFKNLKMESIKNTPPPGSDVSLKTAQNVEHGFA